MLVDLNCDMGEETGNDDALMPWIGSANICCGYHAGNSIVTEETILLAFKHGVRVGAHPSFNDRENFGRKELDSSYEDIYKLVAEQLQSFMRISSKHSIPVQHVKPHGALYNMASKDKMVASAIIAAICTVDSGLRVYGLSGSVLIQEAARAGLECRHEVFADRRYMNDGTLTPRSTPGAVIVDENVALQQVKQLISEGSVTTINGSILPLKAETICIHSDGSNAVKLARKLAGFLKTGSVDF